MFEWENKPEEKENTLILYHGTNDSKLYPRFGLGNKNCDFGQGFYTTKDKELAKEWSRNIFLKGKERYVFEYSIDVVEMNIIDFNSKDLTFSWIASLIRNRLYGEINGFRKRLATKFIDKFGINLNDYDIVKSYRVDDGLFDIIIAFLDGIITVEKMLEFARYGDLGEQIMIKSKKAFSLLREKSSEFVPEEYASKYSKRILEANKRVKINIMYNKIKDGIFIDEIM